MGKYGPTAKILEIGAEGGSITVLSKSGLRGIEYSVRLRDQTLTFLSDDEADREILTKTEWSTNWDDVLKSLGRWPWPMLVPLKVHPEYAARILAAVDAYRDRSGQPPIARSLERWREACGAGAG